MERISPKPGTRAGLAALTAVLVLLAGTGTSVASGAATPLRLAAMAKAAPLDRGAGYGSADEAGRVKALQRVLRETGSRPGPIDGLFGPRTEAAVLRFQRAAGLTGDGVVGRRSWKALGEARSEARRDVAARAEPDDSGRVSWSAPVRTQPVVVRAVERPAVSSAQSVGLSLTMFLTAIALLIGALCGGLIGRARTREQGSAERSAPPYDVVDQLMPAGPPDRGNPAPRERVRAIGYVSVPQANQGAQALDTQAASIDQLCERRGWELLHVVRDVENGHPKGLERPGLLYALERIAEGEASCLVVSELDRLSRSAADLGRIVEWIDERDARLVAIDLRLDTGSAQGRLTARTLVSVGEWEGRRIADQTRKGLAAARARRATTGRPAVEDVPALKQRIVSMRREGMTLQGIADCLNAEGVPTLRGGSEWRPSSVQAAAGYRRPKGRRSNLKDPPKGERS